MLFKLLLDKMEIVETVGEVPTEITAITDLSLKVVKGGVFFAVKGNNNDGRNYVKEVELLGGAVIVSEQKLDTSLCQIIVKDVRKELALCAREFYGNPQEDLRIIGVVGTNGKTSTCHILSSIFTASGFKVGVTGTIGTYYGGKIFESSLTTLGAVDLFRLISDMVKAKVDILIMEISAHAIDQKRCDGIYFDALIYTNCTEDHLDYFEDMERYSAVKKSIFSFENCRYMIVNSDDKVGREIIREKSGNLITYGIENPADVFAIDIVENNNGVNFVINLFDLIYGIDCGLFGLYNVYNLLGACACAATFGVKMHVISLALRRLKPISGRSEPIGEYNGGKIFLDYAHTPDGLKRTLSAMRKICDGKLICLFGCGGNREKQKRPVMGSISGAIADFTVITTDNPRYEDCCQIIREIEDGLKKVTSKYITVSDRKSAIIYALEKLKSGDVLVLCGKGAEKYQEIMGEKRYFSDKKTVNEYIAYKQGDEAY